MKPIEQRIIDLFYEETGKMTLWDLSRGDLRKGQFPEELAGLIDKWLMEKDEDREREALSANPGDIRKRWDWYLGKE